MTTDNLVKVTYCHDHVDMDEGSFFMREGDDPFRHVSFACTIKSITAWEWTNVATAKAVASHLAGDWTVRPMPHCTDPSSPFLLARADGLTLFFSLRSAWNKPDKGLCSYYRPSGPDNARVSVYENGKQLPDPSIHFSVTKTPEQMAKDITRRLIPDAERVHALALRALESDIAHHHRKAECRLLADNHWNELNKWGIDARAEGGSVRISSYMTPEAFKKLIAKLTT